MPWPVLRSPRNTGHGFFRFLNLAHRGASRSALQERLAISTIAARARPPTTTNFTTDDLVVIMQATLAGQGLDMPRATVAELTRRQLWLFARQGLLTA
ncbi:hypothetical protein [Thiobacillus denitrificans]|uniref:hypothetical protein n=1 Tax=Thiobacillus denitrificans TaxID=36861 RepID=UPI000373A491|nr:hypothetical protein [Thiobacillus denitrificans]